MKEHKTSRKKEIWALNVKKISIQRTVYYQIVIILSLPLSLSRSLSLFSPFFSFFVYQLKSCLSRLPFGFEDFILSFFLFFLSLSLFPLYLCLFLSLSPSLCQTLFLNTSFSLSLSHFLQEFFWLVVFFTEAKHVLSHDEPQETIFLNPKKLLFFILSFRKVKERERERERKKERGRERIKKSH